MPSTLIFEVVLNALPANTRQKVIKVIDIRDESSLLVKIIIEYPNTAPLIVYMYILNRRKPGYCD